MKVKINVLALLFGLGLLANAARAETPREPQHSEAMQTLKVSSLDSAAAPEPALLETGSPGPETSPEDTALNHLPEMVRIPGKNFEMGKYEVTQAEWRAVMGSDPSYFSQCGDNCPVESVSWEEIDEYIRKLNAITGRQYRLPTEAEWIYACYAGSETEFCGGDDLAALGWFAGNSDDRTHAVGQKKPNAYGLYDMSGNVWECMSDCYDDSCRKRVLRGGSWSEFMARARAPVRYSFGEEIQYIDIGFRLARTLP